MSERSEPSGSLPRSKALMIQRTDVLSSGAQPTQSPSGPGGRSLPIVKPNAVRIPIPVGP